MLFMIWLFVGGTAFIVRLTAAPPQISGGTTIIEEGQVVTRTGPTEDALLAALLFLALYFATGAVAGVAGYLRHNSAAKRYEATMRNRTDVARIAAASAADLALARQTLVALEEERRRREEGWVKAQEEWQAIARRLKQETRLRLASAAQNPSVTDAYFEPPESLRRPTSGVPVGPISGPPAGPGDGMAPTSPAPYRGAGHPTTYGSVPTGSYGPPPVYPTPPQAYPGQTAVPVQAAPWPLNPSAGAHRPPADHDGTDHREVGR
jgi:hypothetical protein